jgi:hypothetical protein
MVFTKVQNSESRPKAHIFFIRFGMVVHQPQATPVIVSVQDFCSMVIGFFVASCGELWKSFDRVECVEAVVLVFPL